MQPDNTKQNLVQIVFIELQGVEWGLKQGSIWVTEKFWEKIYQDHNR